MKFKYSETWAEELLELAYNEYVTRDETMRLLALIDMADYTDDTEVIRTLFMALLGKDLGGVEETIFGTFEDIDYKVYYSTLFEQIPKILESEDSGLSSYLLGSCIVDESILEKWDVIEKLGNKYLNKEVIEEILKCMENNRYHSLDPDDLEDEDYPYPQFYKLFQKILKEKENNKSEM